MIIVIQCLRFYFDRGVNTRLLGYRIESAPWVWVSVHCLSLGSINGFGLTKIGLVLFHSWHPHEARASWLCSYLTLLWVAVSHLRMQVKLLLIPLYDTARR